MDQQITPDQKPLINQPFQKPALIQKGTAQTIIGAFFLLVAVGIGGYYLKGTNSPKACTQEAKQCPDGSFVGRVGPNCEFQPCLPVNATTFPVKNNNDIYGLKICSDCPVLSLPPLNWCKDGKVVAGDNSIFREKNCYCPAPPTCVD